MTRITLTPKQRERLRRALENVSPGAADVTLDVESTPRGARIAIESPSTSQRWHIGPRGGSW